MTYSLSEAKRNAAKVANNIFGFHLKPEVLDDGKYWVFQWIEETDEPMLCVHQDMGGICLYDPEAHPEFKNAVVI